MAYTLEIGGKPVAVTAIADRAEAEAFFLDDDGAFKGDLLVLESYGLAVWDGKAEMFVRRACDEEIARLEHSFVNAVREGNADEIDRDGWVTFLVPVSDPTDEDDQAGHLRIVK